MHGAIGMKTRDTITHGEGSRDSDAKETGTRVTLTCSQGAGDPKSAGRRSETLMLQGEGSR